MLRVIVGVYLGVLFLISLVLIGYWRDAQYAPSGIDLLVYFLLMPLGVSLLLLSPYVWLKWRKKRNEDLARKQQEQQALDEAPSTEHSQELEAEWHQLKLYSASLNSALGENQDLLQAVADLTGPELDSALLDAQGNPILSYRMQEIDQQLEHEGSDLEVTQSSLQTRLELLLQMQLEQQMQALSQVAAHLKNSALFYDSQLAYAYRMHPAWIDPESTRHTALNAETEAEHEQVAQQVPRLDRLNIHILLAQQQLHRFDELHLQDQIDDFCQSLGILSQQIECRFHYLSDQEGYATWMQLLCEIEQQSHQISLMLLADSEIHQDLLDEKNWIYSAYVPAEFSSSCLIAASPVEVEQLEAIKQINFVFNQKSLSNSLERLELSALEQYEEDATFVSILESPSEKKVFKTLQQRFVDSPIDISHFIYSQSSLGHTQSLSKLYGFMLALHVDQSLHSMVYSTEYPLTQVFISPAEIKQ